MIRSSEKGYTIIELLIVIAVLGCISSAVILNAGGIVGQAEAAPENTPTAQLISEGNNNSQSDWTKLTASTDAAASQMELRIVQTAMDIMMIHENLHQVRPTAATNDMLAFPGENALYPQYLRDSQTRFRYSCDATGQISAIK
jgi:prepilin-type N-terminal cleavage/methylation domain-containing protein